MYEHHLSWEGYDCMLSDMDFVRLDFLINMFKNADNV